MKKRIYCIGLLLACAAPLMAGCDSNGITFVKEEVKKGPQFLEGSLGEISLIDTVVLAEYIDYSLADGSDYKITITNESGKVDDLTSRSTWYPKEPGKYTITYTILKGKNKGTVTFDLVVKVPDISWQYTLQNKPYNVGDVLNFDKYFQDMNISVTSYYSWKMVMDSVEIDNVVYDLSKQTSFTFNSMSNHLFKFHVETEDGQRADAREVISMKYVNQEYLSNLTSRNIELSGDLYVDEGNLTLKAGQFFNGNNTFLQGAAMPHNMPYMAYKGNYGLNSFVMADFTGNNMPLMTFFRNDDYSPSLFDETKGVLISGGFFNNSGSPVGTLMNSRITQYGPYLMNKYYDRDYFGDSPGGSYENPFPGSTEYFARHDENTHYRLLCGFTGFAQSTYTLTYEFLLLDLDNKVELAHYTAQSYNIYKIGKEVRDLGEAYKVDSSFFNGNIVLYGNYGKTTKLDNVYDIITGKTFAQAAAQNAGYNSSVFKSNAPSVLLKNKTYNRSDFGDFTNQNASLSYSTDGKNYVKITTDTFSFDEACDLTLIYNDGTNYGATKYVRVSDYSSETVDQISYHGVTKDAGKVKLGKSYVSSYSNLGDPKSDMIIDQSYVAFNGSYGIDTYLKIDFTGDNMPLMTFFRDNDYSPSIFDETKGVLLSSGIYNNKNDFISNNNDLCSNIQQYGPYMMYKGYYDRDYLGENTKKTNADPYPGSNRYLRNNSQENEYSLIVGFSNFDEANYKLKYEYLLLDRTNNVTLAKHSAESYNIYSIGRDIRKLGNAYQKGKSWYTGNIVLYGNFGKETVLDGMPELITGKTFKEVTEMYCSKFAANAPKTIVAGQDYNKTVFGTFDNEKAYLKYEDQNGNLHTVTGDVLNIPDVGEYTLHYCDGVYPETEMKIYASEKTLTSSANNKYYGVSVDGDKMTFGKGYIGNGATYYGPNTGKIIDQAYAGFDGNYALGTFVELDFTGKNMPEIAFFANNYDNSMYYGDGNKKGILVVSGITNYNGTINSMLSNSTKLTYEFTHMAEHLENNQFCTADYQTSSLCRGNLEDGVNYKVIMGFVASGASAIQLQWKVINRDTSQVIENLTRTTWNFFTGTNDRVDKMTQSDLKGSIVLYGKFGTGMVVDKCVIHESTTLNDVYEAVK